MRTFDWHDISERIKQIRGSKTREAFAKEINSNINTIGNYERGSRKPDADFMFKMYEIGININWLLSGQGPMYNNKTETAAAAAEPVSHYIATNDTNNEQRHAVSEATTIKELDNRLIDLDLTIDEMFTDIESEFNEVPGLKSSLKIAYKFIKRELKFLEKTIDKLTINTKRNTLNKQENNKKTSDDTGVL